MKSLQFYILNHYLVQIILTGQKVISYHIYACMCFHFTSFISLQRGRTQALSSACKIDQADFTDWMTFLTSNLMEEISLNAEVLIEKPKVFYKHGEVGKTMIRYKCFNIANYILITSEISTLNSWYNNMQYICVLFSMQFYLTFFLK